MDGRAKVRRASREASSMPNPRSPPPLKWRRHGLRNSSAFEAGRREYGTGESKGGDDSQTCLRSVSNLTILLYGGKRLTAPCISFRTADLAIKSPVPLLKECINILLLSRQDEVLHSCSFHSLRPCQRRRCFAYCRCRRDDCPPHRHPRSWSSLFGVSGHDIRRPLRQKVEYS